MIIGANGTGKSTMVAAIILGLGGNHKVVGRGNKISEYVKHNCDQATINIFLQGENDKIINIKRVFDKQEKSMWNIDGKKCNQKEIMEFIESHHIQVSNLCQFLPQDKVQDFAKMNKQELLKATQLALCREDLINLQEKLIQNQKRRTELSAYIDRNTSKLFTMQEENNRLEGRIHNFNKKKKYQEKITHINRKIAWIKFEQIRKDVDTVKEDKSKALKNHQDIQNRVKPLQEEIDRVKKLVWKHENRKTNLQKNIDDIRRNLQEHVSKQDQQKKTLDRVNSEIEIKLAELDEMENEIQVKKNKIKEFEEAQRALHNKSGNDEQVVKRLRKLNDDINDVKKTKRLVENRKEEILNNAQNLKAEIRGVNNEINRLENIKQQRMEKLQRIDPHAYQATLWIRNNSHLFSGKVYEPIILELNVLDSKHGIYLENIIEKRDRVAFICEDKNDMNLLIQSLRIQQKLKVNILHSSSEERNYQPNIPIENLRQYGFFAYLDSLFTAPKAITNYLGKLYGIHNIPIGTDKTDQCYEQIPNQIRLFFSDKKRYVVKFSKYTGEKISSQSGIGSDGTLSISIDIMRLNTLKSNLRSLNDRQVEFENESRKFDNQLQHCDERLQELTKEYKVIQEIKQQVINVGLKIENLKKSMEHLKNQNVNKELIKNEGNNKIQKILTAMMKNEQEILTIFNAWKEIISEADINEIKIEKLKEKMIHMENDFKEQKRQLLESEELLNRVKEVYANVVGQAKATLNKAKDLSNGFTPDDEGFNQYREIHDKLSSDTDVLNTEKNELHSKIDCLKVADDGEIQEYEGRYRQIQSLQEDLEHGKAECDRLIAKMDKLQDDWLGPLAEIVANIHLKFSSAFQDMGCLGEVSIYTGDDSKNYANYGISIKVSFRNGSPLQELNANVQSGGERAVSTAIYMLSLQELTPVPFRCVDEINQGMDADNERKIFKLLVNVTAQPHSSQYFLITPKLIPNLKYSANMVVHIVHNGLFINPDRKWSMSKLCNYQGLSIG